MMYGLRIALSTTNMESQTLDEAICDSRRIPVISRICAFEERVMVNPFIVEFHG